MNGTINPAIETLRQADLSDLKRVLDSQRAQAFDVVLPASRIGVEGNNFTVVGVEPAIDERGVTTVDGLYLPSTVAQEGLAAKLDIDLKYLKRCFHKIPDLFQDNVGKLLQRDAEFQGDKGERKFLLRLFKDAASDRGVLRAFLSDQYKVIDNLDVLLAVLSGITNAGIQNPVIDADLTERRMIVRVIVPEIAVYAEEFLKDYRNPFTGENALRGWTPDRLREVALAEGHDVQDKVIFAGFVFSNSEVGAGAFRMTPRVVIGPCTNGLTLTAESIAKTHLGARMDEGIVQWSTETLETNLKLITSQTTDAVKAFLNKDFVQEQVNKLEKAAGFEITKPQQVITTVSKKLGFTEAQADLILGHFIKAGQLTTGGIMQAVTSAAQITRDGDTALEMEQAAVSAMTLAREAERALAKA